MGEGRPQKSWREMVDAEGKGRIRGRNVWVICARGAK